MRLSPKWLITMTLAIVIIVLTTVLMMSKPSINSNEVIPGINATTPISINVSIYVAGPPTLVQKLTALGINQSLIKPITTKQLPKLPNDSLVIIDWSVIDLGLIINDGNTIYVNEDSSNFELLSDLIGHGDFVIIHGNADSVPAIELALALAWSRAYNTSVTAAPIPLYLGDLDYVIAYGNDRALVIGPYTLASALDMAVNLWNPLTMRRPIAYLGSGDVCQYLVQNYSLPMSQSSQVGSVYRYVIDYGG